MAGFARMPAAACLAALMRAFPGVLALQSSSPGGDDGPVPVDFYVFRGRDGGEALMNPRASMNIGGDDNETGFFRLCKDECLVTTGEVASSSNGYMSARLRFCPCIAKLLVEDLAQDFGALAPQGPRPAGGAGFVMGTYKEFDKGQDFYRMEDGHKALHTLMDVTENHTKLAELRRRPGRLTVWIADEIGSNQPNSELAGTTYLDQVLYKGRPGAGVLLSGQSSRAGRRLSHETGHVVGFHHVAGPPVQYYYVHSECKEAACKDFCVVEWKMMSGPNCQRNIMGEWYDGPYCCPWKSNSLLQAAGLHRAGGPSCLENSVTKQHYPYCCGDGCQHKCPKEQPPMTFATSEHKDSLTKIYLCWSYLRGSTKPEYKYGDSVSLHAAGGNLSLAAAPWRVPRGEQAVECSDFPEAQGTCAVPA